MIEHYAHASHAIKGGREYQEDSCLFGLVGRQMHSDEAVAGDGALIAVLADGMGGHVGGAEASRIACQAFQSRFEASEGAYRDRLGLSLDAANAAIGAGVANDPTLDGMGCTLIGAFFDAEGVQWVSVGDSPLYLFREGGIFRLNDDHSMAPLLDDLANRGLMDRREARESPRRHQLRSALTGRPMELVDLPENGVLLQDGDWVIVASDGLDTLTDRELEAVLAEHRSDAPEELAQALIAAVEAVGDPFQDNTTVMAIKPIPSSLSSSDRENETVRTVPLTWRNRPGS